MASAIELVSALTIGTVETVSPDEIRVIVDTDAPLTIALNTGVPTGFPRINGYVLIPNEAGAVVGLIVFLGVERSAFPKRTGLQDFGLIDLPFPLRKLHITPLGTLRVQSSQGDARYKLTRGVGVFPSVGDPVQLPTGEQLTAIVESEGDDRRVQIGTSPLAADAGVFIDPDKLFGRHLAVLGNTGSGKSCTVAGLIRWSLEAATREREVAKKPTSPNARFIILDPNGEYAEAFADLPHPPRIFQVQPTTSEHLPLVVPAWMWNSNEWAAFAQAAPGVQRPLLLEALRAMRGGNGLGTAVDRRVRTVVRTRLIQVRDVINRGASGYAIFPGSRNTGQMFMDTANDLEHYINEVEAHLRSVLESMVDELRGIAAARQWTSAAGVTGYNAFGETDLRKAEELLDAALVTLPVEALTASHAEDAPIPFDVTTLPDLLDAIAQQEGAGNLQFVANLSMRIRMLLADQRLRAIAIPEDDITVVDWLERMVGADDAANGQITIIDLSLVPAEIIHIVIAVLGRVTFEAVQRYRKLKHAVLPTVLVLEEAHAFVRDDRRELDAIATPALMCRTTFEKIAREGRKFGLGLLLSSQRPSELSSTVLAQCNTFLLHRLVNDRDQELVAKLVPDNVRGILRELPSLPAGQAVLLGWAAAVPILLQLNHLPKNHRPQSADPDFWDVWTGRATRQIEWEGIHEDWLR